jgi:hypothetical protein
LSFFSLIFNIISIAWTFECRFSSRFKIRMPPSMSLILSFHLLSINNLLDLCHHLIHTISKFFSDMFLQAFCITSLNIKCNFIIFRSFFFAS